MKAKVALLRTKPETALRDYQRLMDLAEFRRFLDPERPTILKDNISWHFPFPSANTTPWQLEGAIVALKAAGYREISCVQNKTVVTNAFKGTDLNGYWPICRRHEIPVLFNFRDQDTRWVEYRPKARLLVLDRIYNGHIRLPEFFFEKNVVHLPTVKTHIYTTTTGAMKNAFGGLLNEKRHYTHSFIHETLVDLLQIQKEIHTGIFAIMDGTTSGNGAGPRIMQPVRKDVVLASGDQVAIDAVAARLMGFDPMNIKYIRLAHDVGLGVGDPREIEIAGNPEIANQDWGFEVGHTLHSFLGWLAWFGPTKILQKLIFHTPIVHFPNLVSETYHDYYRWNVKEKKIFRAWLQDSPWGRLFAEYREKGCLAPSEAPAAVGTAPS